MLSAIREKSMKGRPALGCSNFGLPEEGPSSRGSAPRCKEIWMRLPFWKALAAACAAVLGVCAAGAFSATAARATGTVTIRQADGATNVYRNVVIEVIRGALFMTSSDGKGTLVIHRAACSYQGQLLVCFATSATLIQGGETNPLDLRNGTIYVNSGGTAAQMALSTIKVPPHSVVLSFSTNRGTYVSLRGRIDKVVQ
jgi:hypothetical protein